MDSLHFGLQLGLSLWVPCWLRNVGDYIGIDMYIYIYMYTYIQSTIQYDGKTAGFTAWFWNLKMEEVHTICSWFMSHIIELWLWVVTGEIKAKSQWEMDISSGGICQSWEFHGVY